MATAKTKTTDKPAVENTSTGAVAKQEQAQTVALTFTTEQTELIKRTMAEGASNDELALFMYQAKRTGLDPLARQIYFVKRQGKVTIQTSIDGFRIVAERSGSYAGQDEPLHFYGKQPKKTSTGKIAPYKTQIKVYKFDANGNRYLAAVGEAFFDEFKPTPPNNFMWEKMPHVMLAKCAEAQALRKAFPQDLSGLYTDDEMQQAAPADKTPEPATDEQRRAFFALAAECGIEADEAKEKAKTHFKVASFNDLNKAQLNALIKGLEKKLADIEAHAATVAQADEAAKEPAPEPQPEQGGDYPQDDEFVTVR